MKYTSSKRTTTIGGAAKKLVRSSFRALNLQMVGKAVPTKPPLLFPEFEQQRYKMRLCSLCIVRVTGLAQDHPLLPMLVG